MEDNERYILLNVAMSDVDFRKFKSILVGRGETISGNVGDYIRDVVKNHEEK